MKYYSIICFTLLFSMKGIAQTTYEVTGQGDQKILKGFITRDLIAQDTAFKWYQQNQAGYTAPAATVTALKEKAPQVQWLVFGGTWCGDTRNILPKFFSILEAAGIQQDHVTLVGVDHSKKAFGHLTEALNITNVPTIIVLKDGKEIGRTIEYGKTGQWDKELGEIVNSIK
ncbi:MAG: thioredoxin family protein [Candidatus Pseudobacter hemicellulosilyticus]|uniref:Thioredoxin family protein n=1 Tax=Candidatus Pseudobacter hemicellulosilyticus TaxID=3121375 RepID=A0AAJ5WUD0_9BACT|nr:MAG: thioredoxin family protein [Pseudobacter sp.]